MSGSYQPYPEQPPGGYGQFPSGYPGPRDYLQGSPVNFGEAIAGAFKNAFIYNGRASRSAYWWFALFNFLATIALYIVIFALVFATKSAGPVFLLAPWVVVMIVTTLPLAVRRLHDSDRSGFWYFIAFVPVIGGIWLLILLCMGSTPGPNKFG
jgi:uncharacterized membrane protein YhaH (DUF805 family)